MKKKCKLCSDQEECDDCFILRVDSDLRLDDAIQAIRSGLSQKNKLIMDQMDYRQKQWLAIQAWMDGQIKWGDQVIARKKRLFK